MHRKRLKRIVTFWAIIVFMIIGINTFDSGGPMESWKPANHILLNVPSLCQYPNLPTGCEATAAAMLLQFYGMDITPEQFASEWLDYDDTYYYSDGNLVRSHPNNCFIGNPFTTNSYGCYAPVIAKAINDNQTLFTATIVDAMNVASLCEQYICQGTPVLIWATMDMAPSKKGNTWFLADGTPFTWISGEHCLVLVGYDSDYYYLNDPQKGVTVSYPKEIVELRYRELGMQAVYLES